MSVKGVINPYQVIDSPDMTVSITSRPTVVLGQDNVSYQVSYTGSPVGEFFVEASNDGINWASLTFVTPITTGGSPNPFLININQIPYAQIRLRYAPDSGSGTLSAVVAAKRLGG